MSYPYGLIGNSRTAALIKTDGSINWLCTPRFDSPSVFAKILDEKGGSLGFDPKYNIKTAQEYLPNTAVLKTTITQKQGAYEILDFLPKKITTKHKAPPYILIIRVMRKIKGNPKIKIIYNPRPNYALAKTRTKIQENKITTKEQNKNKYYILQSTLNIKKAARSFISIKKQEIIVFTTDPKLNITPKYADQMLKETINYWKEYVKTCTLPKKYCGIVARSAITLKLLTYTPTGAIIAAPTTSLPETIGGQRNWDYRYCWLRDASFTIDALGWLCKHIEAKRYLNFLDKLCLNKNLQVLYTIRGEKNLTEKMLPHFQGYKNSRPVRIGNAAAGQFQIDIPGEVIETLWRMHKLYGNQMKKHKKLTWQIVKYLVKIVEKNWNKKDSGIWEFREKLQHFTHSKLMCWVAMDRATALAGLFGKKTPRHWELLRAKIKNNILKKGFNKNLNSFTISYGSSYLDASLCLMSYYDFLPKNDKRIKGTIKAIEKYLLKKQGIVQRYNAPDDFGESTSGFLITSFWLIDALHRIGETKKAEKLFNQAIKLQNHLGLFSEDVDMKTLKQLGNFPQAYTHIAVINTAMALTGMDKHQYVCKS